MATLEGHLTFALKNEGLDLAILKRLFLAAKDDEIAELVKQKPTGLYTRRNWFLYEWLLQCQLNLPTADKVSYVDAVDTELQYGSSGQNSARNRVRNNLPGTPDFCPLVFKTQALTEFVARDLKERAVHVASKSSSRPKTDRSCWTRINRSRPLCRGTRCFGSQANESISNQKLASSTHRWPSLFRAATLQKLCDLHDLSAKTFISNAEVELEQLTRLPLCNEFTPVLRFGGLLRLGGRPLLVL